MKKSWLFGIIGIIIILVIVVSYFAISGESKEYKQCKEEADKKAIDPEYNRVTSSSHEIYMNECLINLAIEKNDINICKQTNQVFKCQGRVSKDIEFCKREYDSDSIEDFSRRWLCIEGVAIETKNSQICSSIEDARLQYNCISDYSKETGDYNICLEIKNLPMDNAQKSADVCMMNLMFDGHYDKEMCSKMTYINNSDYCFEYVGKRLNDVNLCNAISENNIGDKWSCLADVARELSSEEICGMIPNKGEFYFYSVECYKSIAQQKKDASICYLIGEFSENEIPFCLTSVAVVSNDIEVCNQITDERWPNKTICASFDDPDLGYKWDCLDGQAIREKCINKVNLIISRN